MGKEVTKKYIELAKQLDAEYEHKIYFDWQKDNTDIAIGFLKEKILLSKNDVYTVNFAPELKVIIREAKFLDRIGKDIP